LSSEKQDPIGIDYDLTEKLKRTGIEKRRSPDMIIKIYDKY